MGLGDEADQARAREEAEDAAELEQRRQNWAAIDSLVREFIPDAVRRKTPKRGVFFKKRYWCVQHAQSERDELTIWKNGNWHLGRGTQMLAFSSGSRGRGPSGTYPVDGLREGAMRLLNS
jgi:hypothetical protein